MPLATSNTADPPVDPPAGMSIQCWLATSMEESNLVIRLEHSNLAILVIRMEELNLEIRMEESNLEERIQLVGDPHERIKLAEESNQSKNRTCCHVEESNLLCSFLELLLHCCRVEELVAMVELILLVKLDQNAGRSNLN